MRKAGTPPQIVYAYKKTGLLLMEEMREHWPKDRVKEWEDAVEEYFAIEDATKGVNRPNPGGVVDQAEMLCPSSGSISRTWRRSAKSSQRWRRSRREPLKVIVRIELAAAFLATACSAAYDSAEPTGAPGKGPTLYAVTEDMVVKRAREIYGQGRG